MMKMLLTLACAALLFAFAEPRAAEPGTKPAPVAKPEAGKARGPIPRRPSLKRPRTGERGNQARGRCADRGIREL